VTKWQFDEVKKSQVDQDPTQRDQFNNDEVGLAEALVREVIQNSTDAASGPDEVKVTFAVKTLDAAATQTLRKIFESLRPHLAECGVNLAPLALANAKILLIEDFGTRGLTGRTDDLDNDNFRNFWRRHGRSGKGGTSGGRWGLGKLVYSSSSALSAFFGLTVRAGDSNPLLMGQAVLRNHELSGHRHPAHGFWFTERGSEDIQLPVSDFSAIAEFRAMTGLVRALQPGLSIIIPYLKPNITNAAVVDAVIRNYYFPILAGKLVVEVDGTLINRATFHQVAAENAKNNPAIALPFVEAVSKLIGHDPAITANAAPNARGITEKLFSAEQIEEMKTAFRDGGLIYVRMPLSLKRCGGATVQTHIDLFLQSLPEGQKPFALFVRGSITVPGEVRYFTGTQALGAMIANHKDVVEFLGDAENPAHTNWIASAEKLTQRWESAGVVKRIRYALSELYALIAEQVAREDENALIDLFSLVDASRSSKGPKKRTKKPVIEAQPRDKAISIKGRKGGFEVVAGPAAVNWTFPKKIRIRVAYDTMIGNPFSAHSKYDFDLTKSGITIEGINASVAAQNSYILVASVTGPDFVVSGIGFDDNRDLVVDARTS
jgi:hypothetical protein